MENPLRKDEEQPYQFMEGLEKLGKQVMPREGLGVINTLIPI
jgi:hypothetical protein